MDIISGMFYTCNTFSVFFAALTVSFSLAAFPVVKKTITEADATLFKVSELLFNRASAGRPTVCRRMFPVPSESLPHLWIYHVWLKHCRTERLKANLVLHLFALNRCDHLFFTLTHLCTIAIVPAQASNGYNEKTNSIFYRLVIFDNTVLERHVNGNHVGQRTFGQTRDPEENKYQLRWTPSGKLDAAAFRTNSCHYRLQDLGCLVAIIFAFVPKPCSTFCNHIIQCGSFWHWVIRQSGWVTRL